MTPAADTVKSCCAAAYESELARALLGDSFHPGGLQLTRRLGELLGMRPGVRVLDIASGRGDSAIFLAKELGCEVVGIDLGAANVAESGRRAEAAGVGSRVRFAEADAEAIPFPAGAFDYVICECAFCTFPNKNAAACEFARVLKTGGRIGLSDLTRTAPLPSELDGLPAWIACIADARPLGEYVSCMESAGFGGLRTEAHDEALLAMARDVESRVLGLQVMTGLKKLNLPDTDLAQVRQMARAAMKAIQGGMLGYSIVTAEVRA